MTFVIIVLLLDVLAIILFVRDKLKPGTFLTISSFQTGFWAGVLIVEFVAIGRGASSAGIWMSVFTLYVYCAAKSAVELTYRSLTFLGLLIYAIVGHRRAKAAAKRGQYAQAHNPSAPAPLYPQYQSTPEYQPNTAYNSHDIPPVEMYTQYAPPAQSGAANDYYQQQPVKPAHMV
jgi:hypothetical protein